MGEGRIASPSFPRRKSSPAQTGLNVINLNYMFKKAKMVRELPKLQGGDTDVFNEGPSSD